MKVIRENMGGSWTMDNYNLSDRESKEFLEKIK
jgi:hypothetical protein